MCDVCGSTIGHKRGCPEDDSEPEYVGYCDICEEPIEAGERYFEVEGVKSHYDCFTDAHLKDG